MPRNTKHIYLKGTTDIHLLKSDPTSKVTLRLYRENLPGYTLATVLNVANDSFQCVYEPQVSNIVNISVADGFQNQVSFTPNDVTGRGFVALLWQDDDVYHQIILRVWVHESLEAWHAVDNLLLFEGGPNIQVPIYAKFNDTDQCDLTGDPRFTLTDVEGCLAYELPNHDNLTDYAVSNKNFGCVFPLGIDSGGLRVTGFGSAQDVSIETVDVKAHMPARFGAAAASTELGAKIMPGLGSIRSWQDCRNVLVLPEGFGSAESERRRFENIAVTSLWHLMKTGAHSPFGYLAESMNFWAIDGWTTSDTHGVTIGPPVIETTTDPNPFWRLFKRFKEASDDLADEAIHLAPVSSDFGLMIGGRVGVGKERREYYSRTIVYDGTPTAGDMDLAQGWYDSRRSNTLLGWDPRGPWNNTVLGDFLDCIKAPDGSDLGPYFSPDSDNPGLVMFIVNESIKAGTSWGDAIGVSTHVIEPTRQIVITNSGELAIPSGIRSVWQTAFPEHGLDCIAAVLAHELGHALGLGDEYESEGDPLRQRCPSDDDTVTAVENHPNLMHQSKIIEGIVVDPLTDPLEPLNIKWNWRRVSLASKTLDEATWSASGGAYSCYVLVHLRDQELWNEAKEQDRHRPVYLRRSACALTPEVEEIGPANIGNIWGPVSIDGIDDPEGDRIAIELSLDPSVSDVPTGKIKFEKGSVLYVPMVKDGDWSNPVELKLISDSIFQYMATGRNALFRKTSEDDENKGNWTWNADSDLEPIIKSNNNYIVGLFEGGQRYNCGVFRPSARCKMRISYMSGTEKWKPISIPFCPVCKFALVDVVEPERHADLDDGDFKGKWSE